MPYEDKLGERCHVLVTEVSTDGQYYVGHNKCYDQVGLQGCSALGELTKWALSNK